MTAMTDETAPSAGPPGIDPATLHRPDGSVDVPTQLALYEFEKRAYDLFMQNLVKGTSHLRWDRRRSRPPS
jgi:hypothetical protein